jgi:hypothetical protein
MPLPECDIAFLALARNCEKTIPNFMSFLDTLSSTHGFSYRVFVGENGSSDRTKSLLNEDPNLIEVIDTTFMAMMPHRLKRMASGRQAVADHFLRSRLNTRAVAVIDLDNPMLCPPDTAAFVACVKQAEAGEFFAVAATSRPYYYDVLAYEDESQSFAGIDQKIASLQKSKNPIAYYSLFRNRLYPAQKKLTSTSPIECISAFNGLCIYNPVSFALGSYIENADFDLCEHVNFNRRIHEKISKIMVIDPELCVAMPSEHGPMSAFQFAMQRTRKLFLRSAR